MAGEGVEVREGEGKKGNGKGRGTRISEEGHVSFIYATRPKPTANNLKGNSHSVNPYCVSAEHSVCGRGSGGEGGGRGRGGATGEQGNDVLNYILHNFCNHTLTPPPPSLGVVMKCAPHEISSSGLA